MVLVPIITIVGKKSQKDFHDGKSQLEEIKYIKDFIVEKLNIPDRTKIQARRHTSKYQWDELGDYPLSWESVLIDSKLNTKNICVIHEKIFCKSDDLPFMKKFELHKKNKEKYVQKILDRYFGPQDPRPFYTYNRVDFKKINETLSDSD